MNSFMGPPILQQVEGRHKRGAGYQNLTALWDKRREAHSYEAPDWWQNMKDQILGRPQADGTAGHETRLRA